MHRLSPLAAAAEFVVIAPVVVVVDVVVVTLLANTPTEARENTSYAAAA